MLTEWYSADDIFKCTFFNKNLRTAIRISLNLFPRIPLLIRQHCFRRWLGAKQVTSHFPNQWWFSLLTHMRHTTSVCQHLDGTPCNIEIRSTFNLFPLNQDGEHMTDNNLWIKIIYEFWYMPINESHQDLFCILYHIDKITRRWQLSSAAKGHWLVTLGIPSLNY